MATITADNIQIIGGVDTHQDLHTAAVVSHDGTVLGTESFSTTRAGYRAMLRWFRSHGELLRVGVESTGTYGAGITRHLALSGIPVLEVTGPDPASRRAKGKDDALDAISAAEAARTRRRVQVAKDRSGTVEALRVLRTTRKTAIKCRRAALQQLYNTIVAAPEEVRDQVRNLTRMQRLRTCAAWRPDTVGYRDPVVATKLALKYLARRILDINDEIAELDRFIVPLVEELAPSLLELEGVGTENAGAVMVAVGDNPDRLRSEASFAMMCGVCPIPASSGKTQRHRLNRGGNRQANSALHMVVVCRMRTDERTRAYVARRTLEGLSKREIMRCLKRYARSTAYSPPHRVLDKHESVTEPGQGVIPGDPGLGGGLQRLDSAFGQGQLVQRDTFSGGFRHSGLIQCGTRGLPMELAVAALAGQSFISVSIRSAMRCAGSRSCPMVQSAA